MRNTESYRIDQIERSGDCKQNDDAARTFEMHMPDDKGEYRKMMEIEYKRRAE